MADSNDALIRRVGRLLKKNGLRLAVAESCTGGLVSSLLTDVSGSSEYYLGSVVAYGNAVKMRLLGVRRSTIDAHGAVSAETAREMARGVKKALKAEVGLSITGIAGPKGGTPSKPVGTVFVCAAYKGKTTVKKFHFKGARVAIKGKSARGALALLLEALS